MTQKSTAVGLRRGCGAGSVEPCLSRVSSRVLFGWAWALFAVLFHGYAWAQTFDFGQSDAHRPVEHVFALTNAGKTVFTVEAAKANCACLTTEYSRRAVPPGETLTVTCKMELIGMEGDIEKKVVLTLGKAEGREREEEKESATLNAERLTSNGEEATAVQVENVGRPVELAMKGTVRLRVGLKPQDAAFGVVAGEALPKPVEVRLSGYAADARITEVMGVTNAVVPVVMGADGRSLAVSLPADLPLGSLSEVWTVKTTDPEVPVLKFPVSVICSDDIQVVPERLTVSPDDTVVSRLVMLRPTLKGKRFRVLSGETKPREWGKASVQERPLGGWQITVDGIDVNQLRQMSKKPFLLIKTDLAGHQTLEIPIRVE